MLGVVGVETRKNYVIGVFTGMIVMMAVFIGIMVFFPGLLVGGRPSTLPRFNQNSAAQPSPAYPTIGSKVDDIIRILDMVHVTHIDMEEFSDQVFRAVVGILNDPYSVYMNAEQFAAFMEDAEGVYAGIGVQVTTDLDTGHIRVVVPFEGTPGQAAGMLPGDFITHVNGEAVKGGDFLSDAVRQLRGQAGTSVAVTFYRPSTGESFDVVIVREVITVPTVSHSMKDDNIGYLRITQFDRPTYPQFVEAFEDLKRQGMQGMIIDLRNNPGGLLNVVNQITDLLVPEGIIVYTEDKQGRQVFTPSGPQQIDVPLLVLVNGQSASASEVLSGAVRDHGVGQLVGTTTFGKGLVQNIFQLADGSALRVTMATYFTPNSVSIHGYGLTPDHEIDMDIELSVRLNQLTLEEDVQLKYAIDLMREMLR